MNSGLAWLGGGIGRSAVAGGRNGGIVGNEVTPSVRGTDGVTLLSTLPPSFRAIMEPNMIPKRCQNDLTIIALCNDGANDGANVRATANANAAKAGDIAANAANANALQLGIVLKLRGCFCKNNHGCEHQLIQGAEGGIPRSVWAQRYPRGFIDAIVQEIGPLYR